MMLEINEDDLYSPEDLELYDIPFEPVADEFYEVFRYYDGAPFTGKAIADNETYTGERYYINGLPHGLCYGVYRNGQKYYEGSFDHGKSIGEHFTWNEKGVLIAHVDHDVSPLVERKYDDAGRLFFEHFIREEIENYYYKTGQLLSTQKEGLLQVFSLSGEVAYTRQYNDYEDHAGAFEIDGQYTYDYHDDVLKKNMAELAGEQELRNDLVYWIYDLEERDRAGAIMILNMLIGHENLFVKSEAIRIAGDSGYIECLPAIRKELKNQAVPGHERDHRGLISYTNDTPISETAREAVGAITGAN